MSKRLILRAAWLALAAVAWAPGSAAAGDTVRVVASLPNLGSIASEVGGDRIDLTVIATGTQDAHFVDPRPSFMIKLRKADLLLVNGLDLEIGWIPPLTEGARNPKILRGAKGYIDCSAGITPVEIPATLSRAEGDVHPYGNPHYLTDPLNAETVATTIASALASVDPGSAPLYEERRKAFVERLHRALFGGELVDLVGGSKLSREARAGTLDRLLDGTSFQGEPLRSRLGGWMARMEAVNDHPVVTYHRDYSYFALRFGLNIAAYVEPKPGIAPSPKHLEELTQLLSEGRIRVIISRPFLEHRSTDLLEERTGVETITLPLDVGGAKGVDDFFQLFDLVTGSISEALGGAHRAGEK